MFDIFSALPTPVATDVSELSPAVIEAAEKLDATVLGRISLRSPEVGLQQVLSLEFDDDQITYGLRLTHQRRLDGRREEIRVIDTRSSNGEVVVGRGCILCEPEKEHGYDEAYVGWTKTYMGYEREGLATRRLRIMNSLSEVLLGKVLHSSHNIKPFAKAAWQRLESHGLVTRYSQARYERWRFLTDTELHY